MKYFRPETHYKYLGAYHFGPRLNYDYKRKGIINKLISPVIYNTKNKTTRMLVDFLETFAQFFTEYIGELKNFKNPFKRLY